MIEITNRNAPLTIVAFSGIAPQNHVYEWTKALADLPVNVVGVQDPDNSWWQRNAREMATSIRYALGSVSGDRWIALGASAGGFGAIRFGGSLGAERIVTFVPQTACGITKRRLGDHRWREYCEGTLDFDLARWADGVEIHVGEDPLDVLHAERLRGARITRYPGIGHDLPHRLKEDGRLAAILEDAIMGVMA
jgi:hypothetical protein